MSELFSLPTPMARCPHVHTCKSSIMTLLVLMAVFSPPSSGQLNRGERKGTNTLGIRAWIHFISLSLSPSFQEVFLFAVADHWMNERTKKAALPQKMPTNDKCRVYHWAMTMVGEQQKNCPKFMIYYSFVCCCCNRIDENLIRPNILFIDRNGKVSHSRTITTQWMVSNHWLRAGFDGRTLNLHKPSQNRIELSRLIKY